MTDPGPTAPVSMAKQALLALESLQGRLDASERARTEPIAIIGMGCRFPGGIADADGLWSMLRDGKDVTSGVPAARRAQLGAPPPGADGRTWTQRGGFLDRVDGFDADFFEISPREAIAMDPQQRLVLEVAWEALEDAGLPPDRLARSQTGVFVGTTTHDYLQLQTLSGLTAIDSYFGTGTSPSLLSGRVSYFLGLQGPSLTVDTACSSSLVTVHLACQALRAGECDLALAGGVNLLLSPELTAYFVKIAALAPDGRCKAFDASADGFARSEGCGMIVLKRLSDALAEGDDILAVVRGSAVNQDGRSNGLTAPNGAAQEAVIGRALANAKLDGSAVDYVEAHGSGTPLGDPIELRALASVMGGRRPVDRKLLVGSVKSNFGHVEAAAGIAGLMKVVVALRNETIPAHLHCAAPTPLIPWDEVQVAIPTAPVAWPQRDGPRYAGVSSFGLSGTNAHAILSDAPPTRRAERPAEPPGLPQLLMLSARSDTALRDLAGRYRARLAADPDLPLPDLCAAAATQRAHHHHRLAIVGADRQAFLDRLDGFLRGEAMPGVMPRAIRDLFAFAEQEDDWTWRFSMT